MKNPEENILKYKDLKILLRDMCQFHNLNVSGMTTATVVNMLKIKIKNPRSVFSIVRCDPNDRESQYLFKLKAAVIKQREHKKRLDVFGSIGS